MNKVLVTEKQRNLILNSEAAKTSFENLYAFLIEHQEIKYEDLQKYSELNNLSSYYDELINACRSEWEIAKIQPSKDLGENFREYKRICSLCGYKYLKIENRIQNKINKKTLVIGTECVKEFGESINAMVMLAQRDSKRATNRYVLENEIPGIRKFVESSSKFVDTLDLIIPIHLEQKWRKISEEINKAYNNYIDEKNKNISILMEYWKKKELIIQDIEKFINDNRNKKNIADRTILEWLLSNNKHSEIRMIRENLGIINWAIAHRIYEPNLMESLLRELYKHFIEMGIEISTFNPKQRLVNLKFSKKNRFLTASIIYEELILNHGGFIFEESIEDTFEDIYDNCDVVERDSQNKLIDLIRKTKSNYKLLKKYRADNEILFIKENEYFLVNFKKLIHDLKKLYFRDETSLKEVYYALEKNIIKTMNKKEHENYKQSKELASKLIR
ncbi:hypothetical protein [Domibacillus epiphyticus]|uniref:Uncharacterized protein n=1 Tax=Domibacillus epiphyticus TaxID=1714355 RepID=A0A1V2A898_9BACI|nr:hypothetical protein [Domibacillus epiphyticus]OMP67044.1 hypothetical protein BTO28_08645 [Domibacillus epiphyticus]